MTHEEYCCEKFKNLAVGLDGISINEKGETEELCWDDGYAVWFKSIPDYDFVFCPYCGMKLE